MIGGSQIALKHFGKPQRDLIIQPSVGRHRSAYAGWMNRKEHNPERVDLSRLGFEPLGKWRKGFAEGKGRKAD